MFDGVFSAFRHTDLAVDARILGACAVVLMSVFLDSDPRSPYRGKEKKINDLGPTTAYILLPRANHVPYLPILPLRSHSIPFFVWHLAASPDP